MAGAGNAGRALNAMRLAGKKALVTGASRGIGASVARRFAAEGADVAITWFNSAEAAEAVVAELRAQGITAEVIRADAGDAAAMRAAVAQARERLGGLNVLVNNAGIFDGQPLPDTTEADFDRTIDVNLRGPYVAALAAAEGMASGDTIINMASAFGLRVPAPGLGLYAMSKHALIGLTRGLARDLGPRGITVSAIAPGPIETAMNRAEGRSARLMSMMTALGKYGAPEDVAGLAVYLASADAAYVTGAVMSVDGGFGA